MSAESDTVTLPRELAERALKCAKAVRILHALKHTQDYAAAIEDELAAILAQSQGSLLPKNEQGEGTT